MASEQDVTALDRDDVLELIDEIRTEIVEEDMTGLTREQVAHATCTRIENQIRWMDDG
jgi:hypothetical protein